MEKKSLIYEGKAKKVYSTKNEDNVIIYYKDSATAFNGKKEDVIKDKGIINNKITEIIFNIIENHGIKTHFIKVINDREQLCEKVEVIPLEVIVRNVIAGSMSKRLNIKEGTIPNNTIFEICYKEDNLGDPLINFDHAVSLELASYEELKKIKKISIEINDILKKLFYEQDVILVDFKIEFGKNNMNEIILVDEISPDSCRLWDKNTMKKLDKDRFRNDLGSVEDAYLEILNRLS